MWALWISIEGKSDKIVTNIADLFRYIQHYFPCIRWITSHLWNEWGMQTQYMYLQIISHFETMSDSRNSFTLTFVIYFDSESAYDYGLRWYKLLESTYRSR